jgi:hypothetical protein
MNTPTLAYTTKPFQVSWSKYVPIIAMDAALFLGGVICVVYTPEGSFGTLIYVLGALLLLIGTIVFLKLLYMYSILRHNGKWFTANNHCYVEFTDKNGNRVGVYRCTDDATHDDVHAFSVTIGEDGHVIDDKLQNRVKKVKTE